MTRNSAEGLTLVEALLSIVILALMASVIGALYVGGLEAMAAQGDRALLDSARRSQMEKLISEKFDQLSSDSATITVNGQDYTVSWTLATIDLDGDTIPEPTAKLITVTLDGTSLSTIVVDDETKVGKI